MKIIGILFLLLLVAGLLLAVLGKLLFDRLVMRRPLPLPAFFNRLLRGSREADRYAADAALAEKKFFSLCPESIEMKTPDGTVLRALLLRPPRPNGILLVACHGARGSGARDFCFFAPDFYRKGYTVLLPDHRGCGRSDGDHITYGVGESRDLQRWLSLIRQRFPGERPYLLGVSMGAAAALMLCDKGRSTGVCGIIADGPYTSAWEEFAYRLKARFHLPAFPLLSLCDLFNRRRFGCSFRDAAPLRHVRRANTPILFLQEERDELVPLYMQEQLYDACPGEKYRLTVPGAAHARGYYTDPELYGKAVEGFIKLTQYRTAAPSNGGQSTGERNL